MRLYQRDAVDLVGGSPLADLSFFIREMMYSSRLPCSQRGCASTSFIVATVPFALQTVHSQFSSPKLAINTLKFFTSLFKLKNYKEPYQLPFKIKSPPSSPCC